MTDAPSVPVKSSSAPATCGIIMPIGDCQPYRAGHWRDVLSILESSIKDAGMTPRLVSESDDATIIQGNIVRNIYQNEIAVCDISARNPNVMLELGLRLAFDKPVVIVFDKEGSYPFDTSSLEYIPYPHDLRYQSIEDFKSKLKNKLLATLKAFGENTHRSFLDSYGDFKIIKLKETEISGTEAIIDEIKNLKLDIRRLSRRSHTPMSMPMNISDEAATESRVFMLGADLDLAIKITEHIENAWGPLVDLIKMDQSGPIYTLLVQAKAPSPNVWPRIGTDINNMLLKRG